MQVDVTRTHNFTDNSSSLCKITTQIFTEKTKFQAGANVMHASHMTCLYNSSYTERTSQRILNLSSEGTPRNMCRNKLCVYLYFSLSGMQLRLNQTIGLKSKINFYTLLPYRHKGMLLKQKYICIIVIQKQRNVCVL